MTAPTPAKRAETQPGPTRTDLQAAISAAMTAPLTRLLSLVDDVRIEQGVGEQDVVGDLERLGWSDIAEAYDRYCEENPDRFDR